MPAKKAKQIHPMRCIRNLYLYQEPSFVKMDQNPLNIVSKTLLLLTFSRERLSWQNSVVDATWTTKSQTKTCAVLTTVTIRLPVVVVLSFRRRCLSSLLLQRRRRRQRERHKTIGLINKNNRSARAFYVFVHFFAVINKTTT